ncbi:CPK28, partial [Symbiodinium pilosum]
EGGSGRMRKHEEPLGWGKHSHLRYRQRQSNKNLGLQFLRPKIAKASCGGGFSVVMSTEGEVFTFGVSASGRLGFRTKFRA